MFGHLIFMVIRHDLHGNCHVYHGQIPYLDVFPMFFPLHSNFSLLQNHIESLFPPARTCI